MVEAAQARQGNQIGIRRWSWLDPASIGRVIAQRIVDAILWRSKGHNGGLGRFRFNTATC
jgi:hypothetical protein